MENVQIGGIEPEADLLALLDAGAVLGDNHNPDAVGDLDDKLVFESQRLFQQYLAGDFI